MSISSNTLFVKQLIEFGLSEKEAKAYLALLELEVAAVSEVSKTANINRSSAYVVLESLKKKGLVSISEDKRVQRYVAVSPDLLLREAENRAKKTEEIKNKISNIVPELKALHKDTRLRPKMKVFEGRKGLKEVYWDILYTKEAKDLRTFSDAVTMFKMFPDFMEHSLERVGKGIKMYAINPLTKELPDLLSKHTLPPYDEFLIIPKGKFRSSNNIAIYGNKIALASPKEEFGIIIESKEIADAMKDVFNLAWEEAKRIKIKALLKTKKQ